MSFSEIYSVQQSGLTGSLVEIEIDISKGLRSFSIVGLGDKSVEEAKDRISSAIKNSGFRSPKNKSEKVVISLAPGHIRKNGTQFDVAMALAYLRATGEIYFDQKNTCFFGELSLNGDIRPIEGILPLVRFAKDKGFTTFFLPKENATEAALVKDVYIYGALSLREIIEHVSSKIGTENIMRSRKYIEVQRHSIHKSSTPQVLCDVSNIRGNKHVKRALSIAASGRHNIALYGPPGTGKTMLGKAFASILPPLDDEEMLDVTSIHSICGTLNNNVITQPPFRSPHHTASLISIIGGGRNIRPGEITLAHKGVLFLDEFPEFDRRVIESLRQPLEELEVNISRAYENFTFPSDFILFASMNPCPCGFYNTGLRECKCSLSMIQSYKKKLSGPIMDRIDMWVEVSNIEYEDMANKNLSDECSDDIRNKVSRLKVLQQNRFGRKKFNSQMDSRDLDRNILLSTNACKIIEKAVKKLNLSMRSYHKILKIARTIADLEIIESSKDIDNIREKIDSNRLIRSSHVLEALQYRTRFFD